MASGIAFLLQVFAGCCQPLLRDGPSRRYLCHSFPACLDPYSGCSQGARARCFPKDIGLPRVRTGSAHRFIPTATSVGCHFRSCSHSLMFRPAGLLATPVAPTSHPWALGSRGLYIRAYHGPLPRRAADMLTVQIRAIDGKEDFHLSRLAVLSAAPLTFDLSGLPEAGPLEGMVRHRYPWA